MVNDQKLEMPRIPIHNPGPAPTDLVERALWQYAYLAHGSGASHPLDWRRFYKFVVFAHNRRKGWDVGEVKSRLIRYGFSKEKALEMAEVYWHGRCVLRIRNRWSEGDYSGWVGRNGTCWT